jgi:hypothetical protein
LWLLGPKKTILGEATVLNVHELYFSIKLLDKNFGNLPAFDSVVRMAFTRKADGIYGVEAPLVSFDPSAGIVKCRHTLKFKRNQLRQDVRVDMDMMVGVRLIASTKADVADDRAFMVKMTNLSGGGFAFISERKMASGDTVIVTASSSKLVIDAVEAKLIGVTQNKLSEKYLYHAQFTVIDLDKKEKIIKYVFNRLRELTLR